MRTCIPSVMLLVMIASMSACGTNDASENAMDPHEEALMMADRIKLMEDSVYAQDFFDRRGVQALHDVYIAFAQKYPGDTLTAGILFRAAGTARGLKRFNESIKLYDQVIKDFPRWHKRVDALYLKAFTIDNDLKQKGPARQAYQEVISKYPDHRFAKDAAAVMENLDLSDEELIKKFQEMNEQEATRVTTGN